VHLAACHKWENQRHRYRVPAHHLLLIESGTVEARPPTGRFIAKAGDLICFRPADWTEYGTEAPAVVYEAHLEFAPPPRHRLTPNLDEFGPLPVHVSLGAAFEEMRGVFETICAEIAEPGALHRLRLRAAVHELLALVVSVLKHEDRGVKHLDPWQRARLRLDSELHGGCDIGRIAREMGLTPRYFSRMFRQRFELNPKAYHVHARLREAARLLRRTDKPIKNIALEMGFADPRIFSRLFKHHLGVLPSDIRLGVTPPPEESPTEAGQLFPLNRHLLPPESGPNWRVVYFPRKRKPDYVMTVPAERKP
jgi:AraC-like DNA-binding protein